MLGSKIKTLRKKKGMTLEKLAKTIGSGKSYIWELENNKIKNPSALIVGKIAKKLKVTTDYLIYDDHPKISPFNQPLDEPLDQAFIQNYLATQDKTKEKIRKLAKVQWEYDE